MSTPSKGLIAVVALIIVIIGGFFVLMPYFGVGGVPEHVPVSTQPTERSSSHISQQIENTTDASARPSNVEMPPPAIEPIRAVEEPQPADETPSLMVEEREALIQQFNQRESIQSYNTQQNRQSGREALQADSEFRDAALDRVSQDPEEIANAVPNDYGYPNQELVPVEQQFNQNPQVQSYSTSETRKKRASSLQGDEGFRNAVAEKLNGVQN